MNGLAFRCASALTLGLCIFHGSAAGQAVLRNGAGAPSVTNASERTIDLQTVLQLAGANNLDLALVKEGLAQAKANSAAATLGFLPWLSAGLAYTKHEGPAQNFNGEIVEVDKQLRTQAGSVNAQVDLGNAIFQRFANARLETAARRNVDAQTNSTAFNAAAAYFELATATANVGIAQESTRIAREYENQLQRAVAIGLTSKSEELRASVQAQGSEITLRRAREAKVTASANLVQLLHLDPSTILAPADPMAPQVFLVPVDGSVADLVAEALVTRPEIKANAAAREAADWQHKQTIFGPLIPSVSAQALYGRIRNGVDPVQGDRPESRDYSVMFGWRVGPGGLLDISRIASADSKFQQAKLNEAKVRDEVARQVTQALESARSAADQVTLARTGAQLAERALMLSQERKEFGFAAVLEVIQAQKELTQARSDYVKALSQFSVSQYGLARAIGRIDQE